MMKIELPNGNVVKCSVEELQLYIQQYGPLPDGSVVTADTDEGEQK